MSEAEYAANVVAACQWARDHDHWIVLGIPSSINDQDGTSTGMVDLKILETMLSGAYQYKHTDGSLITLDPTDIAIVCITHVPTNSGIVNPVQNIGEQIAKFNNEQLRQDEGNAAHSIRYLVDACQSVGQLDIEFQVTTILELSRIRGKLDQQLFSRRRLKGTQTPKKGRNKHKSDY